LNEDLLVSRQIRCGVRYDKAPIADFASALPEALQVAKASALHAPAAIVAISKEHVGMLQGLSKKCFKQHEVHYLKSALNCPRSQFIGVMPKIFLSVHRSAARSGITCEGCRSGKLIDSSGVAPSSGLPAPVFVALSSKPILHTRLRPGNTVRPLCAQQENIQR